MEEENQKRILDPFEWIEVNYQLNNATEKDKLFTGQELKNLYYDNLIESYKEKIGYDASFYVVNIGDGPVKF